MSRATSQRIRRLRPDEIPPVAVLPPRRQSSTPRAAIAPRRILVVDDNPAIHDDYRKILCRDLSDTAIDDLEQHLFGEPVPTQRTPYLIDSAFQGEEALVKVHELAEQGERYSVAFVDMRMPPGWDGVQTIEALFAADSEIQVAICTAYSDYSWEDLLDRFGETDRLLILKKPFDAAELCQLACALAEKWQLGRRARLKLDELQNMVEERTSKFAVANAALRASEARYALAAAGANDGLWDWSAETGTIYLSPRCKEMLGDAAQGRSVTAEELYPLVHSEDQPRLATELRAHLAGDSELFRVEFRVHQGGGFRWFLCRGLAVRGDSGHAIRMAGSITDVSERKTAEEQLRHDALHDVLTGLANRALFLDRVRQSLIRRKRSKESFAVLFIDLDRFKGINDSLGHHMGDQVLLMVARKLVACLRSGDTVGTSAGEVGRLGGDEFVVLLRDLRNDSDAVTVANRIHATLSQPVTIDGTEISVAASIGIALGDGDDETAEDLIRNADTAMYRAKTSGATEVFNAVMHEHALSRWGTENDLRGALHRRELFLAYQPVVDLASGRIVELEALVRWQHPTRGLVSPGEFIPLAEDTGLIIPVGDYVLRAACEQLATWRREIPSADDLAIAVNISARQFAQPQLADDIARVLRETGLQPRHLKVEITESVMIGDDIWKGTMGRLHELGVRLHLDDFGTGCSSLSYLVRMPIGALKIDRSFVADMLGQAASASIVETIITLAHKLDMKVVAEGVEEAAQLERLRELGCDLVQGYFLGRPSAPAVIETLLREAAGG